MSENNDSSSEGALDGADLQAPDGATEREQRMVDQRRELGEKLNKTRARNDLLEARNANLEKQLARVEGKSPPVDSGGSEPPAWFKAYTEKTDERLDSLSSGWRDNVKASNIKQIMAAVPDGNREDAKVYLAGLEAGGLDLTSASAVADATAKLQSTPVMFDASRGTPRSAPQMMPDGSGRVDTSIYTKWSEVPKEFRGQASVDPKEFDRLMSGERGGDEQTCNI